MGDRVECNGLVWSKVPCLLSNSRPGGSHQGNKTACQAATTSNVSLSTDLQIGYVLDDVILKSGMRVLIKNQTTAVQNGIYVVSDTGAPVRATDLTTGQDAVDVHHVVVAPALLLQYDIHGSRHFWSS